MIKIIKNYDNLFLKNKDGITWDSLNYKAKPPLVYGMEFLFLKSVS